MSRNVSQTVSFHAFVRDVESQWQAAPNIEPEQQAAVLVAPQEPAAAPVDGLVVLLEEINERVEAIRNAHAQNLTELQELAIELAVAIAAHVVKEKLEANELKLENLAQAAITQLLPAERITVSINPLDALDLENVLQDELTRFKQNVEIIHNRELPRGACLVVGDDHGLLGTLENRLETVRETLLQGIEYARIERGKTLDTGGSLRRFPDGRKLA
jgi:flagellar biosynthesis/type III secretory pathway protein FliH